MKQWSLMALRVTVGWLMVLWGLDKVTNVEHAVRVSDGFYGGLISGTTVWQVAGVAQIVLGLLVVLGLWRRLAYPVLLAVTGITLLAVWRSIIDPHGFVIEGGNLLFFPSSTIFFAALTLRAFQSEDELAVDARRPGGA